MKNLTLSLLCSGLIITTTAIAEENCLVFYKAQNYEKSAQCFVQKLKIERSFANLSSVGISYSEQGRYKEALPYLKEAENKATTPSDYIVLYSWLGTAYASSGDPVQELAYDMKVLSLTIESGIRGNIGTAYGNIGEYYRKQNQPKKALEYYEKALEYTEESGRATTYGNMAIAYGDLSNYPKKEEMYQKAIVVDQQTGAHATLGLHKSNLGIFYFIQGRMDEARSTLEESNAISHNAGNIISEAHSLSILSRIDHREGHVDEAKAKAAEGLRLAKQSGSSIALSDAQYASDIVNGKQ